MISVECGHYIKGIHNLLNAHFDLRNYQQFTKVLVQMENAASIPFIQHNDNFRVQVFVYVYSAKINWHLMTGTFEEGLALIPALEEQLEQNQQYLDKHRILVFNYKIAMLHFGCGNFESCIDYLLHIIHDSLDLRYDLQCYARLLHLMAHYELGNTSIIESLIKSVYRFMSKMKNLTVVEEAIFKFLKNSFYSPSQPTKNDFAAFLKTIKNYEKSRFETRAFAYLDIISWVESKLSGLTMGTVIYQKYKNHKKRNY
jgi:hypothetical protein